MARASSGSLRLKGQYVEPFKNQAVKTIFDAYPPALRSELLALHDLIFCTASEIDGVGPLEETLKWGQPSYLTSASKSGTTIRLDKVGKDSNDYGLFVHCQTTLVPTYQQLYADVLTCDGTRCIRFGENDDPPEVAMRHGIALTLTYHLRKKRS